MLTIVYLSSVFQQAIQMTYYNFLLLFTKGHVFVCLSSPGVSTHIKENIVRFVRRMYAMTMPVITVAHVRPRGVAMAANPNVRVQAHLKVK